MKEFILIVLAVLAAQYIQGILFVIFRANKYEDALAKKIAYEIMKTIKELNKKRSI